MAENDAQGEWTLPDGWVRTTLGEACVIVLGQSPPSSTYNTEGVGLPFYQGKAEFGDLHPTPVKWCSHPNKIAEAGDVLISVRAPVGPTNLCREQSCIGRGLSAIRPTDGMSSLYLLYYLRSIEQDWQSKATGTTFSAITGNVLRGQEIPLAPLPEQRRIVAEIETQFTRLDAAIAALERARANIRRYKAAVLKAACEGRLVLTEAELARTEGRDYEPADQLLARILAERRAHWEAEHPGKRYKEPASPDTEGLPELPEGWCWASLGQLSSHVTSGSRGWAKYYSESGSLFVRVGNFNRLDIRVDLDNVVFVDAPDGPEANRTRLKVGDWLITITADVGMVGVVDEQVLRWGEAFINQHVGLVRPVSAEVGSYVAWALASEPLQFQFRNRQYGATKKGLNLDDLRSLVIPIPPLAEQRRIGAEVERRLSLVAALEASVEAALARAGQLRQSILKRAFEGRLVPQDPADEPASELLKRIKASRERLQEEQRRRRAAERRQRAKQEKRREISIRTSSELRELLEQLQQQSGSPVLADELFEASNLGTEAFHTLLREEVRAGYIREHREGYKAFLEITDESQEPMD